VNVVSPGSIDTEGLRELLGGSPAEQQRKEGIAQRVPIGHMGRQEEIEKAVLFHASDDSSYVTGAELFVDGGMAQV
jgi:NAD(P)-dependent dehydrogenase (short-subunit alcohol dehydrogenase family)